jgi:hypothetical protein
MPRKLCQCLGKERAVRPFKKSGAFIVVSPLKLLLKTEGTLHVPNIGNKFCVAPHGQRLPLVLPSTTVATPPSVGPAPAPRPSFSRVSLIDALSYDSNNAGAE